MSWRQVDGCLRHRRREVRPAASERLCWNVLCYCGVGLRFVACQLSQAFQHLPRLSQAFVWKMLLPLHATLILIGTEEAGSPQDTSGGLVRGPHRGASQIAAEFFSNWPSQFSKLPT
jgi:hypothetical protein